MRSRIDLIVFVAVILTFPCAFETGLALEQSRAGSLDESGQLTVDGRMIPYRIRNLPVSSFPELPSPVAAVLSDRGCVIPQTYEAKRPENVVHGSLERPGSSDWAVLCSARDKVTLLIFFASAPASEPLVLGSASKMDRLQPHDATGQLGFNWGIDPAGPRRIRDAQAGMDHRPPAPDHDCLADSVVDHKTVYHLYRNGGWETVRIE